MDLRMVAAEDTMTKFRVGLFSAGLLALLPVAGAAIDRWEAGSFTDDDGSFTHNELIHGTVQRGHDLDGAPDQDWTVLRAKARHSYEARVGSGSTIWALPGCQGCATFDRVDQGGTVLTPGFADGATNSGRKRHDQPSWTTPQRRRERIPAG